MSSPNTSSNTNSLVEKFLTIGKIEGYSYLPPLLVAMPLKYLADIPIAVRIMGSIHGILFIAFMYYIILMIAQKRLTILNAFYSFVLSLIPFGTFFLRRLV